MDFKEEIEKILKKLTKEEISLEIPPNPEMGDYAFPCFTLSKKLKKDANEIAQDLCKQIELKDPIKEVRIMGPYLNFFVNKKIMAKNALGDIFKKKKYCKRKKEKVMIEFCQVNTHKSFHVGHMRGTFLGDSIIRIMKFNGYNVVSANYQGDIGTHVAKVLWYLTKHFKGRYPKKLKGEWLGKIYQKANQKIGDNKTYKKEVAEVLKKIEDGDKELIKLWKETRQWSLDDYDVFYELIGVKFDKLFFESEFEKPGKNIVQKMLKSKKAKISEGAVVIDLEKYNLGVFLLLKSDGTALYSTKDLALAEEKFKKYKIDKSIYVVGAEQSLHFKQVFKTLEILGFKKAKNCVHVPYSLVTLQGGKISSREGELIYAEELVRQIIEKAKKGIKERHKKLKKKEIDERGKAIGLGALRFGFVNQDNNKEIIFNSDKALEFEGETGPYIQYAHARICSILRKYGKKVSDKVDYGWLIEKEEVGLIKTLKEFPDIVLSISENYKVHLLSQYLLKLSQQFNEFYHARQVLSEEKGLIEARILLIDCVRNVLSSGLGLLGIDAIERM